MATTTNYSWTTPDNTAYVKDGASAIRTLGSSVDTTLFTALGGTYPGLRLVKKQTIGNGVSTVSVTNAFSATYDAYRIVLVGGTTSTAEAINFQLGPTSVSQYNSQYYSNLIFASIAGGSVTAIGTGATSSFPYVVYSEGANGYNTFFDVVSPFATKYAQVSGSRGGINASSNVGTHNGFHNSLNSFSGFQLFTSSGTMTGGTIYVYGYGAS